MMKQIAAVVSCFLAVSCALVKPRPAPPVKGNPFPVEEAGTLDLPGRVLFALAGPGPRIFLVLDEGDLLCLDAEERRILWTYRSAAPGAFAPALGEQSVYLCDRENVHSVGFDGALVFKRHIGEGITSAATEDGGVIYLGTGGGGLLALDPRTNGEPLWAFSAEAPVRSAPVIAGDKIYFGDENGTLYALDRSGRPAWSFQGRGRILASPAVSGKRIFFGTEEQFFYCLDAARGRKKWSFKLGGGPVGPPLLLGKRILFPASNSVIYCLSRRRGEILWWKPLPSRVLYDPVVIGAAAVVSSASSEIMALELKSGREAGGTEVSGEMSAGALWLPPRLVVIVRDPKVRAVDRVVFLESIPTGGNGAF